MDRRQFLATGSAFALAFPLTGTRVFAAAAPGDAALNATFEKIFDEQVATSPTLATQLALDKGPLASLRFHFDTRPIAQARAEEIARTKKFIAMLEAVPESGLSEPAKLNREVVLWDLKTQNVGPERFGLSNPQSPYELSQQDGAYFSVPDFLDSGHTIDNANDAEAYLSRLSEFPTLLDNETTEQRRQAARGYLAPGWSLDLVEKQILAVREPKAAENGMVTSLATRAAAKGLPGNWAARATAIVEGQVYPALDRQLATVRELRPTTRPGDGLWRVPRGDEIYAAALAEATTTTMTADEIHAIGLQQVAEISAELDTLLRAAGYTKGSVGERLTALNKDPAQLYPDTEAGRAELIAGLNTGIANIKAKLPRAFHIVPPEPLDIRRVPPEIQDGASNGYYRQASLDGSRPAIYFINLKTTADWPKYSLPALTYHEGYPGHHLQLMTAQNAGDMPMLRRIAFYSAYGEGWALYAESVADELGGYEGIERAGFLQSYLFRAERLVVDTGLNHKRWTREQAIDHMVAATGFPRPRVQREIERYCASPGQACSYKIGHIAWVRARERAQKALGAQWDVRDFHAILEEGAMPLSILDRRVDERVKAKLAGGPAKGERG
jgi:uncharacterized protein (DUF885 family)